MVSMKTASRSESSTTPILKSSPATPSDPVVAVAPIIQLARKLPFVQPEHSVGVHRMSAGWSDVAFQIEASLAEEAMAAWWWLFPEQWTPLLCSMVGGIFLQSRDGSVHWLDTGTGLIEQVPASREQFEATLRANAPIVKEWFLPGLVERLHDAGKRPRAGQCYGFTVLPVFAEGKYEPENMFVVSAREQLVGIASIHQQLSSLPDGSSVRIEVTD